MGSLTLQISTNNGGNWSNIWSLSGDQATGWNPNTISLTPYINYYVRLRFVGSPNGNRSDMAIDNIGLTVRIGKENAVSAMRDCTVITVPYHINNNKSGAIAIVGPTRMEYQKVIPLIKYLAAKMSKLYKE